MKRLGHAGFCCVLATCAVCFAPPLAAQNKALEVTPSARTGVAPSATSQTGDSSFYGRVLKNRLEIGTRSTCFALLENKRDTPRENSFVGTVNRLKEDQHLAPFKPYVQYKVLSFLGVGASYDDFGAEAWDNEGTDGTAELSGPMVYLLASYPNPFPLVPFCELGAAFYSAEFHKSSGWGHDRSNKHIDLNDPKGYYVALGCDVLVHKRWTVNLYGRYTNVDVDGSWFDGTKTHDNVIFTMSHASIGLGVKYCF